MGSPFAHIVEPDLRQILEVLLPKRDPAQAASPARLPSSGRSVEIEFLGSDFYVLGDWRKDLAGTQIELANLIKHQEFAKATSIVLIDPSLSAQES